MNYALYIYTHCDKLFSQFAWHIGLLRKKVIILQVTTILATSKNVLFPSHNHLLTTGTDDPSLSLVQWLAGGYDLEIGHL